MSRSESSLHVVRSIAGVRRHWPALLLLLPVGCAPAPTASSSSVPSANPPPLRAVSSAEPAASAEAAPTYVLATGTVYYSGDPQHGHQADGTFRRGTKVTVLRRAGGYSLVQTADGQQGYVVAHTLQPAEVQ